MLTLKAERKFEKESKKENFHRLERAYGSFQRSFGLPEGVNVDKIGAKYDKGVLRGNAAQDAREAEEDASD